MQFFITFLEGVITFVSPCVLPLIPLYILYFAGETTDGKKFRALKNALAFVIGFTAVFVSLGVFAGTLGSLMTKYSTAVNIVTGVIVVIFGLHYVGVIKINFLNKTLKPESKFKPTGFFSALLFGIVFAIGWSPCTGTFLGSAMLLAANEQSSITGMLLLLCYSLGLGIPFLLCAILIDKLKTAFDFIKKHYLTVNRVCGIFLIIIGILMMTGLFSRLSVMLR